MKLSNELLAKIITIFLLLLLILFSLMFSNIYKKKVLENYTEMELTEDDYTSNDFSDKCVKFEPQPSPIEEDSYIYYSPAPSPSMYNSFFSNFTLFSNAPAPSFSPSPSPSFSPSPSPSPDSTSTDLTE